MAVTLTGDIGAQVSAQLTNTLELSTGSIKLLAGSNTNSWTIAAGTGADQADLAFVDQRTLAASTGESLDLNGGGLTDPYGQTLVFVKLKAIYFSAAAANGDTMSFGGVSNHVPVFGAVADFIYVRAGGLFVWTAPDVTGIAVSAGTGDLIRVLNNDSGATATYDIILIGTSA